VRIYTDLAALLADPMVEAVDVALPIPAMRDAVVQALQSGKHLLSEKPIATTVRDGRELLALYPGDSPRVWMIGENWRYESAFVQAAEIIRSGEIGTPLTCHYAFYAPLLPGSKYFHTAWRRDGHYQGGMLLDGGVHLVAALRLLMGEVTAVSAQVRQIAPYLLPVDTLSATLRFANGALGTLLVSYGVGAPWTPYLHVVGEQGALRVQRGEVEITSQGSTRTITCAKMDGVERELAAFAAAIRGKSTHVNTPAEALRDLEVVEALLKAAELGQEVTI
jgi:predicted dehydrogenase